MITLLRQRLERDYELDGKRYTVRVLDDFVGKGPTVDVYCARSRVPGDRWPEALRVAINEWLAQPGVSR